MKTEDVCHMCGVIFGERYVFELVMPDGLKLRACGVCTERHVAVNALHRLASCAETVIRGKAAPMRVTF